MFKHSRSMSFLQHPFHNRFFLHCLFRIYLFTTTFPHFAVTRSFRNCGLRIADVHFDSSQKFLPHLCFRMTFSQSETNQQTSLIKSSSGSSILQGCFCNTDFYKSISAVLVPQLCFHKSPFHNFLSATVFPQL